MTSSSTIANRLPNVLVVFAVFLGLTFTLLLPAAAQDATAVPVSPFDPANCTAEPISTDHAAALMATPVASPALPLTASGLVDLPLGAPADSETIQAIEVVVGQLWSCNNARDKARVYGMFTDQAIQETIGFTEGTSWDSAELRADVAAALTPDDPRTEDEWATVDSIVSITLYDDGQVGALILNTDPFVMDGDQVLDYFRFIPVEGTFMVSGVVLDPFDLATGYGFEKAA